MTKDLKIIPSWPTKLDNNLLHFGFGGIDDSTPTRTLELGNGKVTIIAMQEEGSDKEVVVPNSKDKKRLVALLSVAMASRGGRTIGGEWNASVEGMTVGRFLHLCDGTPKPSQKAYARFKETLRRWMSVKIRFHGSFRDGTDKNGKAIYCDSEIHVVDSFKIRRGGNATFTVNFNSDFIRLLRDSRFYSWISSKEYSRMKSPVAVRLFEILEKSYHRPVSKDRKNRPVFSIEATELGAMIPLKEKYPSQILRKVEHAFKQVEEATNGRYELQVRKEKPKRTFFDFYLDPNKKYKPFQFLDITNPAMPLSDNILDNVECRIGKLVPINSEKAREAVTIWVDHCTEYGYDDLLDAIGDIVYAVESMYDEVPEDKYDITDKYDMYLYMLIQDRYRKQSKQK